MTIIILSHFYYAFKFWLGYSNSSFGNFGGMGNKGEREDFQSPSSGGALF